ncbi:hypothetical protein L5515_016333 [Caenorhabditis briggsae]|uniref:Uncharacterized protein n=1 Tax=Caenorhabditis briggsae TaxID=6238 RepID=A0AAE9JR51_CAEBR|nr:hypothetical protein L5515_016333 [Caenorhabditis briggsae]
MFFWLLFVFSVLPLGQLQVFEGSGEENLVDEYWLQRLIETVQIPHYLTQKAYQLAENSKLDVDEEELLTLDASVPDHAKEIFTREIIEASEESQESLVNATEKLMSVVYFAFRPFGCDQDNTWPSVYNMSSDNLNCIAFTLLQKVYDKSEFTRKYLARAIHFGITSKAPIDHRIHEMLVYQYLLPNLDRVWFNSMKIQLKNSFWNEQEFTKTPTYEDDSFFCGSMPFTDEVQDKINYYYTSR